MKLDVLADLDHLLMINFSAPAKQLVSLVPAPMRLLVRDGRGFLSIVLARIENLRPVKLGFPRLACELFGLRILVEYESANLGPTKGSYFSRLMMDRSSTRLAANVFTPFSFEKGHIETKHQSDGSIAFSAAFGTGATAIRATAYPSEHFPSTLPPSSSFATAEEALAMYNDIAFGFLPRSSKGVHVLQFAEPHANCITWPLRHLQLRESLLSMGPYLSEFDLVLEPCYFVGRFLQHWRWLPSESPVSDFVPVPAPAA